MAYGFNDDKSKFDLANILGNIATVETGSTASKLYYVGDYLVQNNTLYKVISNIGVGATLTVGTNIEQTTVENELKSIGDVYYREITFEANSGLNNLSLARIYIIPSIKLAQITGNFNPSSVGNFTKTVITHMPARIFSITAEGISVTNTVNYGGTVNLDFSKISTGFNYLETTYIYSELDSLYPLSSFDKV